jgi:NADH-quinone oxidoreductase subunit G
MSKVTITVDGQEIQVEQGTNLIEAAKIAHQQIPHYCYHEGLTPDGNCRMCLVQVEKIPKPVIACRTLATEGMVVHTQNDEVKKMRQNVMEFLLVNHPLDCPTCDQAGECRLQDYYMDYDLGPSRYTEEKVHKDKMVDLGADIMLDEERCIVCTRCVRVCQEVAKDEELYVQQRGNHSMVATFPGKKMTNPYAGNTIDVCPVGALTSKDFRYKKRVWFLSYTDSICPGCSRGCNTSIHHADNKVFRLKPKHNAEVNDFWMCDAGRYDYKFINENRQLKHGYNTSNGYEEASYEETFTRFSELTKGYDPDQIAFIASAGESCEEIDAFVKLAKEVFGAKKVYYSKNDPENAFSDDILITADKNPNMAHIEKLGLSPVSEIKEPTSTTIIQRGLNEKDQKILQDKGLGILLLFAVNQSELNRQAKTIFPIPSYAEQGGSFTNLNGLTQKFHQAFSHKGESRLIRHYFEDLKTLDVGLKVAS